MSRLKIPDDHPKKNFLREHVFVAEQMLGRKLKPGETVHHIDENKHNNNPENLMVFASNRDHVIFHSSHKAYEKDRIWYGIPNVHMFICDYCGKTFESEWLRKYQHKYCSKTCLYLAQRKSKDYTKEELLSLIYKFKGNFKKAAESIGITDKALRKRFKSKGLPYHSIDYR